MRTWCGASASFPARAASTCCATCGSPTSSSTPGERIAPRPCGTGRRGSPRVQTPRWSGSTPPTVFTSTACSTLRQGTARDPARGRGGSAAIDSHGAGVGGGDLPVHGRLAGLLLATASRLGRPHRARPRRPAVRRVGAQVGGTPDPARPARRLERQHLLSHAGHSGLLGAPPRAGGRAGPVSEGFSQLDRRLQLSLLELLRRQRAHRLLDAAQERALVAGRRAGGLDVCLLLVPALPDGPPPDPHRPVDSSHFMVLGPPAGGAHGEERRPLPALLPAES